MCLSVQATNKNIAWEGDIIGIIIMLYIAFRVQDISSRIETKNYCGK